MPEAPLPNCLPPDSIATTSAGMHSGLSPYVLSANQLAFGLNITNRGGYPGTRPPLWRMSLRYTGTTQADMRARFQGAAFYQSISQNPSCLVASIGGQLFRFAITNRRAVVDNITPYQSDGVTLDVNDPTLMQAWLAQGQDFLVVQDGQSNPYFFDGAGVRRSRSYAGQELPPGRQIHYVNGRFVMALPNGISYIASDLVYNTSSGTIAYNYRDSILRITDNIAILAGQAFGVPVTSGSITSLFSVAIPDTSLGQGPLQVGTEGGVFSVNLPLDATLWTTTQQPSQVVSLPNGGPTGFYAVATVNGDAWYRGGDGLRSYVVARRDYNTWVQTSLSFEMDRVLPFDTTNLLPYASAVNFNNRLLCTCSPYRTNRGIAHRGLVALDFNNVSSITTRAQPSYDGLWTGLSILQILKGKFGGVERCFLFALDINGDICLYELGYDDAAWFDFNGFENIPTQCWIESGALYGKEYQPAAITQPLKKLITGDLFLKELAGPARTDGIVTFTTSYRSDQWPCWVDWATFRLCAPSCYHPTGCDQPQTVRQQYATFKRLPEPADSACNQVTKRPHRFGYNFQVKIAWEGRAALHRFNSWVTPSPATRNVACDTSPTCEVLVCCDDDLFSYQIETPAICDLEITQQPTLEFPIEWDVGTDAPVIETDTGGVVVSEDAT